MEEEEKKGRFMKREVQSDAKRGKSWKLKRDEETKEGKVERKEVKI